jgi:serine/threonine-protein kinase RIO1
MSATGMQVEPNSNHIVGLLRALYWSDIKLGECIGTGQSSRVYKAWHTVLGDVVVKIYKDVSPVVCFL